MLHFLNLAWTLGKFYKFLVFIFNRAASFTGAYYFIKKGRKTGRRIYFAIAFGIYVGSWILVILGTSFLMHFVRHLFEKYF